MSRRNEGSLFVGRLSKSCRVRDLEDVFEPYGRMSRCEIKYGAEMAYAFVDFEDRRDAEDAVRYENGREVAGSAIIVEWAKGAPRRSSRDSRDMRDFNSRDSGRSRGSDECYRCRKSGHWARDCPDDRHYGFRRPDQRARSPRRRRSKSRSRSRSRDRRSRTRSRSRDRKRGSRRSKSRSRSGSVDKKSRSRSRSGSRSRSKSADGPGMNVGAADKSGSKSRSASPDKEKSASP